jgi:hypothetical protein
MSICAILKLNFIVGDYQDCYDGWLPSDPYIYP